MQWERSLPMKSLRFITFVTLILLSGCTPTISNFNSPVQPITSPVWLEYAPYSAKEFTTSTVSMNLPGQAQNNQTSNLICDTVITLQNDGLLKKYFCEQSDNYRVDTFSITAKLSVLGEFTDVSLSSGTLDHEEINNIANKLIKSFSPVISNPIVSGKSIFKVDVSNFLDILGVESTGAATIDEVVRGWSTYNGKKVLVVDITGNITIEGTDLFNGDFNITGYKLIDPTTMAILKSEGSAKGRLSFNKSIDLVAETMEQSMRKVQNNASTIGSNSNTPSSLESVKFEILSSTHLDFYTPTNKTVFTKKKTGQSYKKTFDEAVSAYDSNDYDQALGKWLPLAAKGHPESAFRIADMYDFALGVEQDYQQAAMWYLTAAQRGHGEAQCKIANRYSIGQGIQVSRKESYKWSWLCSRNKDASSASKNYANIYMRTAHSVGTLSSEEIRQIELQAKMWTPKPALSLTSTINRQSNNKITFNKALVYYNNNDFNQAFDAWLLSANQGHSESAYRVAEMYDSGLAAEKDQQKSAKWYLIAAGSGYGDAQCKVADRYSGGIGLSQNHREAYKWSRLCSNNKEASPDLKSQADLYLWAVYLDGTLSSGEIKKIEHQVLTWEPK